MSEFFFAPLALVDANPFQPRQHVEAGALVALQRSLTLHGLLQEPTARLVNGEGEVVSEERHRQALAAEDAEAFLTLNGLRVQLSFGHRRKLALDALDREEDGWPARLPAGTIRVKLRALADVAMADQAMEENGKREGVSAVEEAEAFRARIEAFGWTHEELGRRYGYSRSAVSNKLRLLRLPEAVREANREGRLAEGKARALVPMYDALREHPELVEAMSRIQIEAPDYLLSQAFEAPSAHTVETWVQRWVSRVEQEAARAAREASGPPEREEGGEPERFPEGTELEEGEIAAEVNRLVSVYHRADGWRTGATQPADVGQEVILKTLTALRSGVRGAEALAAQVERQGLDPASTPGGRWNVAYLLERLRADVATYERVLAEKREVEPGGDGLDAGDGEDDGFDDGGRQLAEAAEKAGLVPFAEGTEDGADAARGVDVASREDPTVTVGPRVRWTTDGWPWEPQLPGAHEVDLATKERLRELIRAYDVGERSRYGVSFLPSGKKAHYQEVAREVLRYHANLQACLRLSEGEADALAAWIDAEVERGARRATLPWAVEVLWAHEYREVQRLELLGEREAVAYDRLMARRAGAFCYHLFLERTEGARPAGARAMVSVETCQPAEAPGSDA
ncbi:MAG TPA: hypothetical protein EYQ24_10440 [Bacteroidetes bacterium]|nr:hypothetical protein [Bacteroidota bacterium]HIL57957.1 hypothetical protein [Rhodothermales bacterium]